MPYCRFDVMRKKTLMRSDGADPTSGEELRKTAADSFKKVLQAEMSAGPERERKRVPKPNGYTV